MNQFTIQLPAELYDAVRQRAAKQQTSPDSLVAEWVSEQLDTTEADEALAAFEGEAAAFDRLKPSLLDQFDGQYVAVYQGRVVAHGADRFDLLRQVHQTFGPVACYIDLVESGSSIRKVRVPSVWVVKP